MAIIWHSQNIPSLEQLRLRRSGTMVEHIGIEITEVGDDFLEGTLPVDHRTKQPYGILHGGASLVLAETLGSIGGNLVVDSQKSICVGLEINANHIRSCTQGHVKGRATPLHLGSKTQVWEIKLTQDDKLVCISRITLAVLSKNK